jgi:Tol biopolymer transport system component
LRLGPGKRLLHYRIDEKIGEGGMGQVWRAIDTTLDRSVAIKLLPESVAVDAERLARFEREAKTLAALNHPHIAGLFGLHEAEGARFLSMELVSGEDLAQRVKRGPIPIDEVVSIGIAVAGALSAAHAIGVVHRDLKPANVMLTPDGEPKVLDFGLAKAVAPETSASGDPVSASLSPTMTSLGTAAGMILGTAAYMSPEQARGKAVDRRSDLWAFGAMLYEMLTGKAPFGGETISDILASVLKTEPDWEALPAATPPAVRRLLRRCLEKNPRDRLHDAADARIELLHAFDQDDGHAAEHGSTAGGISRGLVLLAAGVALIGGAALGYALHGDSTAAPRAPSRRVVSSLTTPPGVTVSVRQLSIAISPDGRQFAFVGEDAAGQARVYVRRLDSSEARTLEGTEGATTLFWSADSREIGYHAGSRLYRILADGGTPQLVAEAAGRDGTWNADGTIVFANLSSGSLSRVDAQGGEPEPLEGTNLGRGVDYLAPQFLPDGQQLVYQLEDLEGDASGLYLGRLGSPDVRRLLPGFTNAVYSDGRLLYLKDGSLVSQPFEGPTWELTGKPSRVAETVLRLNYPFHGFFSVASSGGPLIYLSGGEVAAKCELVWVDRAGNELERTGIVGDLYNQRLSPDGRMVAVDMSTLETHGDIWVHDLARGSSRRLTDDSIDESRPIWVPDQSEILFFRLPHLYAIDTAGGTEARKLYGEEGQHFFQDLAPDGRRAIFFSINGDRRTANLLDLGTGESTEWFPVEQGEYEFRISPDGKWVAFQSEESGRSEVYVDRFPGLGERFRISSEGAGKPIWSGDGSELFYLTLAGDVMVVPCDMESASNPIGRPERLFSARLRRNYYEVAPDGQRFLLNELDELDVSSIVLVQNWATDLGN